jgi:16S rRNA (cytosine1402-N4)-methyltransferase
VTVGNGGHTFALATESGPDGHVFGIDRDAEALVYARERLRDFGDRVELIHGNYKDVDSLLLNRQESLDGVLADLGVSSPQLLTPSRGFSFEREGPLDMRMDRSHGETALDYLRRVSPRELEERLREAGEERFAEKLVKVLCEGRDHWQTTLDMSRAVAAVIPRWGRTHPATRVFMALRMVVNQELEGLNVFLEKIPSFLKPGGRLVVISFHSTEDRIVKRFYPREGAIGPRVMKRVTKSPLIPTWEERKRNPRSRSAKLRVFERVYP